MELVSHSRKFVFLKTRKTVGTNVEMLLERLSVSSDHVVNEKCSALISDQGTIGALKISLVQQRESWAFEHAGYPENPLQEL